MQISVSELLRIIIGMPMQRDNLPAMSFVFAQGGRSQRASWMTLGITPLLIEHFFPVSLLLFSRVSSESLVGTVSIE